MDPGETDVPRYELRNEHRLCFGLQPVQPEWQVRLVAGRNFPSLKVYFHDGRIRKYIRFQERPNQIHYHEVDVDLLTTDEARTWSTPGGRGKPKKVQQASLPAGKGFEVFWNGYPQQKVAMLECRHVPSRSVVVSSGEIAFTDAAGVARWADAFAAGADEAHRARLTQLQGGRPRPAAPWLPGDFVAFEVAERSWLFARLLLPVQHLAELGLLLPGFDDPARPPHAWRSVVAPIWWSRLLRLPTSNASPAADALRGAARLPGGFLVQPAQDDGRSRVVGHAPLLPNELDLPESLQRWDYMGRVTYGYDWGLVHLELGAGTAVDDLQVSPLGPKARHVPLYDLAGIEAQLRLQPDGNIEHLFGRAATDAPGCQARAVVLGALGLSPDTDYDALCVQTGVPDRVSLADLLNAVPPPGLRPSLPTR